MVIGGIEIDVQTHLAGQTVEVEEVQYSLEITSLVRPDSLEDGSTPFAFRNQTMPRPVNSALETLWRHR
jgi:hypothetical protein